MKPMLFVVMIAVLAMLGCGGKGFTAADQDGADQGDVAAETGQQDDAEPDAADDRGAPDAGEEDATEAGHDAAPDATEAGQDDATPDATESGQQDAGDEQAQEDAGPEGGNDGGHEASTDAPIEAAPDDAGPCGCASTQACDVDQQGHKQCFPLVGKAAGALCSVGECAWGLSCVRGVCHQTCTQPADCGMTSCVQAMLANGSLIGGWYVCSDQCDPRDEDACGAGRGCYMASKTASLCMVAGTSSGACEQDWQCQAGSGCQQNSGCLPRCSSTAECSSPEQCRVRFVNYAAYSEQVNGTFMGLCEP